MHATCLHCTKALGANDVLETLPIGRRIAFDAAQGRLWVVCRHCTRWNLVPFDTRLESIDAAERLFRDTRTRYSTDNIGLARVPEGLELVRIGRALRPEFVAWRYGESYRRRRRQSLLAGGAGIAGMAALMGVSGAAATGVAIGAGLGAFGFEGYWMAWRTAIRWKARFRVADPIESGRVLTMGLSTLQQAALVLDDTMRLEIPRTLLGRSPSHAAWSGQSVQTVGRRAIGSLNLLAGTRRQLEHATSLLADHRGDLEEWLRHELSQRSDWRQRMNGPVSREPRTQAFFFHPGRPPRVLLASLPSGDRLALEMWMNEDIERTWLEGELKLLEREWREADRLAKIADGLALEGAGVDPARR